MKPSSDRTRSGDTQSGRAHRSRLSFDAFDERRDPRPDVQDFDHVVASAISRRGFLGVLAVGSGAAAMGTGTFLSTLAGTVEASEVTGATASRFGFEPIPIATDGTVHVPGGYRWQVLASWGQPLFSDVPAFDPATGGTAESQARSFGENTDGMELFAIGGRQVLAVNHEYVNPDVNLVAAAAAAREAAEAAAREAQANAEAGSGTETDATAVDAVVEVLPRSLEEVRKLQYAQGVSVVEVAEGEDGWSVVTDSPFNRRITHLTPMRIAGPAAGHELLKTGADPDGTSVLGTMNNCGSGRTPWGTYLTCEENFNGYFGSTDPEASLPEAFARYGIEAESRYAYEQFDERFDVSKNPNEPNRFGYIVEIDPSDASSTPVKRTAMGRFKHENAAAVLARDGRVVVYMGDDERGEFLYKYVSRQPYVPGGDTDTLLDDGQLFVARFDDDTSGQWLALTPEATGMGAAEILIHTRMAASAVGATTMDRPEWVAVNPVAAEAYCALTNNKNRGIEPNAGGDPTPVGGPNPREANNFGQIVRWYPTDDDHAAERFEWDLYVMAGNPEVFDDAYAGSANVHAGNLFNSPDCIQLDSTGLLWIQTDGDDGNEEEFAGMGNNQMLVGDPATGEIVRFLTGPNGCEVTGLTWSSDRRTMFVGIQHPGGTFPDGIEGMPRSSIIAVKREDNELLA